MYARLVAPALLAVLSASAVFAAGSEPVADPTLTSATGGAQVRKNRFLEWHPAGQGRKLPADSELTCAAGCSVRTSDGSTLTLDPGALVTVGSLNFMLIENGPFASLGRRFELRTGGVKVNVVNDKKRPRMIVVGTPNDGIVAIRPGETHVVVTGDHAGVSSSSGGARIKQGSRSLDLEAGHAATLGSSDAPLTARAVSQGVEWEEPRGKLDEPQPLAVALDNGAGSLGLSWRAVAGASGYRFEVSRDETFAKLTQAVNLKADQHSVTMRSLPEGTYFGRVIVLDRDGLRSRPSKPAPLRVVALQTPQGGTFDTAAALVIAPKGSSVRISDSSHLEMAVDDHRFRPASGELLVDDAPHLVRFRVEGDFGRETRLHVEPRALKAEIHIGPTSARWPDDAIDMSIDIRDPSGRFDPESVEPKVDVMLGVEPIDVEWKREGSRLTARLAPRTLVAPEVLRVVVRDQGGVQIGRNFLEIEASPPARPEKTLAKR